MCIAPARRRGPDRLGTGWGGATSELSLTQPLFVMAVSPLPYASFAGVAGSGASGEVAQGDSGQCRHVRRFLLGLYNSHKWPFELIRLRNLDSNLLDDCLAVLELDARGGNEVHTYIKNGDELWKSWWAMEDHEE